MKKLRSLLSAATKRPIIYSSISKTLIGLCAVLLWDRFVNANNFVKLGIVDTGFFCAGAWFVLWAWFQYLALDGMRPFRRPGNGESEVETKGGRLSFDALINTNTEAFADLTDEERTAVRFCSNIIVAILFLVPSIVAVML